MVLTTFPDRLYRSYTRHETLLIYINKFTVGPWTHITQLDPCRCTRRMRNTHFIDRTVECTVIFTIAVRPDYGICPDITILNWSGNTIFTTQI